MPNNERPVQTDVVLSEIIERAALLPLEYQECLLAVANGMRFTKKYMLNNQSGENGSL